jgi:2',3'-cyclic-nucleotide 2'-phosphodiesterase / 3'-nucleotidase / 5'-nucleotidase
MFVVSERVFHCAHAITIFFVCMVSSTMTSAQPPHLELSLLSTYATGVFSSGASEINAYDPLTKTIFATNSFQKRVDVLNMSNVAVSLPIITSIDVQSYGIDPNSVAYAPNSTYIAVCGSNIVNSSSPGKVLFFSSVTYSFLGEVIVGAVPDMVTFTKDGKTLLVANEGELANTNNATSTNPEGSVAIISGITFTPFSYVIQTVQFTQYDGQESTLRSQNIRITEGVSASKDIEPEYITIYDDLAYVTLQENNAIAVINITSATIVKLIGLGYKDHGLVRNSLDASDQDNNITIRNYTNLFGIYMPDSIASYKPAGYSSPLLVIANEGDARYEARRIGAAAVVLDPVAFPNAAALKVNSVLGRLDISTLDGKNANNQYEKLYSYGARSFSIVDSSSGNIIYDSGNEFETKIAALYGFAGFNSNHEENPSPDNRSDNKGPEPEAITVGLIQGYTYAFIGLERQGGVMVSMIEDHLR